MSDSIRLFLVDSSTLFRRLLASFLNRKRSFKVIGEAATGCEALALVRELKPHIVIVELEVPEGGPKLVLDLVEESPDCAVLVLTLKGEPDTVSIVLRAGARGYLRKDCEPNDLIEAIQRIHRGEVVLTSELAASIVRGLGEVTTSEYRAAGPIDSLGLTEREIQVLRLRGRGLTNQEIARELYITAYTVKGHVAKILGKLGLSNRVQLATVAVNQRLD